MASSFIRTAETEASIVIAEGFVGCLPGEDVLTTLEFVIFVDEESLGPEESIEASVVRAAASETQVFGFALDFSLPGDGSLDAMGLRLSMGVIGGIWSKRKENRRASSTPFPAEDDEPPFESAAPPPTDAAPAVDNVVAAGEKIVVPEEMSDEKGEKPVDGRRFRDVVGFASSEGGRENSRCRCNCDPFESCCC